MPASEAVLTVVREWIVMADHDLAVRREVRRKLPKAALPKKEK